jgi:succinate dehydrogenase / fumarate reductase, cytochrome b subunit
MAEAKKRPIAPHLTDGMRLHWRWGPAMFISILHRVTGNGLAIVGLGTLLCWLGALAGGPESYAAFAEQAGSWYGMVILVGVSWAFFGHMASGLRHFVMDIGGGFELSRNNLWSILTPIIGILLTAAFWAAMLLR